MLYGKELGDAISTALAQNGKSQADAARQLGVKPPSVTGWIKTGRIGKNKLIDLINWLDKTPLEHWGVEALHARSPADVVDAFDDWRLKASPRSVAVIDMLKIAARRNALTEADWELIEQLAVRFAK